MSMPFRSRLSLVLAFTLIGATSAFAAEEPSGCDKFKWNIDHARAALTGPDRAKLNSGADMASWPTTAFTLSLVAPDDAKLPTQPERAPKEGTFAGFTKITNAPKAALYTVSLSVGGWVDMVQDGHFLKPVAFSGATDCEGIRKTMKYQLSASPVVLQISGSKESTISVAILPAE